MSREDAGAIPNLKPEPTHAGSDVTAAGKVVRSEERAKEEIGAQTPTAARNTGVNAIAVVAMAPETVRVEASGIAGVISEGKEPRLHAAEAMTMGAQGSQPRLMAAGPARLVVGVFDGTYGWLRVRAELGTGRTVHAALTASAAAHESLRAALPEMASYLKTESAGVSRITLERLAEGRSDAAWNAMGAGDGQGQDATRQGAANGQERQSAVKGTVVEMERRDEKPEAAMTDEAEATGLQYWNGGGMYAMTEWRVGFGMSGGWLDVCA